MLNLGLAHPIWEILEKHSNLQPTTEKLINILTNFLYTMSSDGYKRGTRYCCFPNYVTFCSFEQQFG